MIEMNHDDSGVTLELSADTDLISAESAREKLLAAIAGTDAPIWLDLSEAPPTAPALQLLFAARRSLQAVDRFAGFGPNTAVHLGAAKSSEPAPPFTSVRTAA